MRQWLLLLPLQRKLDERARNSSVHARASAAGACASHKKSARAGGRALLLREPHKPHRQRVRAKARFSARFRSRFHVRLLSGNGRLLWLLPLPLPLLLLLLLLLLLERVDVEQARLAHEHEVEQLRVARAARAAQPLARRSVGVGARRHRRQHLLRHKQHP
jgi:hypothetical protein